MVFLINISLVQQYPAGTPEIIPWTVDGPAASASGTAATATPLSTQTGANKRSAFIGSCKHRIWEAIRASSAAPYYLDDFSYGELHTGYHEHQIDTINTNCWQVCLFFFISNRYKPLARWSNCCQ